MRNVSCLVCLTILASAAWAVADETTTIDAASTVGIAVTSEIDPVDPSWVRCTIDWLRPSDEAAVSVHGPASVVAATLPESGTGTTGRWSSESFQVATGDRSELLLALEPNDPSQPVLVLIERRDGSVIFQAGVSLAYDGAATVASAQTNFRVRHEELNDGQGAVIVEHLGSPVPTKAQVFAESGANRSIPDGPTDCGSASIEWPLTTFLSISSAPSGATATAITVHLTVNHPVMANLQIAFSRDFYSVARYLWKNGAGSNIDEDFTSDVYSHSLPGIGEPVNSDWVLALRDCYAGNTGLLDYWSVRIEYAAATTIDLVADSLSVDPTTVEAGDTVEVDWAGHVGGSGTVGGPFTVGFYLSTDSNITTGDVLLGQATESSAQNPPDTFGQSSPGRILTIPGGTADGAYFLGVIVDSADVVDETNEGNNVSWSQLTVAAAPTTIDLVADSVSTGTASVVAGDSIQLNYAGHATGGGTIGTNFSLGFYLSTDGSITTGDVLLGQRVGAWATTGGDNFSATGYPVTIPPATPAGTYYVGFWVDDTNVVTESNESNNTALHQPLTVTGGGGACPVSIDPPSNTISWQGGSETVMVDTTIGCEWSAVSTVPWIVVTSPTPITGPGSVSYLVAENDGGERNGGIFIGDQFHAVSQDETPPCATGDVPDDGTVENGYGWGTGNIFVQEFTPYTYPFVYTDVCVGFTQAGGDTQLFFDVLIFDDDGPGGGPGTLLGSVPASVAGVPAWLDHVIRTVEVESAGVSIDEGSVFIGVGWDESSEVGFFVAADESAGTPVRSGYFSSGGGPWNSITATFANYRSLVVRADGFSPSDGEWKQVVGSIFGGGNGFGDPANITVPTMEAFSGALYIGTENPFGAEVNYTFNGEDWFLGNSSGFATVGNEGIATLIQFGGQLYAATMNPLFGTQVWRTTAPFAWLLMEDAGLGDSLNTSAPSGAVFDGDLYLGTSHTGGCEVWRTPDGIAWTQVHTNGFGNSLNEVAGSMAVYGGQLYVGTKNVTGAELWRSPDGIIWFSVIAGGLGTASNAAITNLEVFEGTLYAGVSNSVTGAQLWRSVNGASWTQVVGDGFGDPFNSEFNALGIGDLGLMAAVSGPLRPGEIWQSPDGSTWSAISSPGFTDSDNEAIGALQYWGDRVFAATSNPTAGCEVWRGGRYPVFEDGFESGDTGAWSVAVP